VEESLIIFKATSSVIAEMYFEVTAGNEKVFVTFWPHDQDGQDRLVGLIALIPHYGMDGVAQDQENSFTLDF
jgi:hypothetical protein